MDKEQFTGFLAETLRMGAVCCRDGAIAFAFMDWRHMGELLAAGEQAFSELKSVCVWNKTNGGMGAALCATRARRKAAKVAQKRKTSEIMTH